MFQPPDLGRMELAVDDHTRVWKGDKQIPLSELAPGDDLLFNRTARTPTSQGRCTDIWAGVDTQKLATEKERAAHQAVLKKNGRPAWIDRVEGKQITITFFAASHAEFIATVNCDPPRNHPVYTVLCNEKLQPEAAPAEKMGVLTRLPEGNDAGTYGSSRVRWLLDPEKLPPDYRPGRIVRVLEDAPPVAAEPKQ
jgi:hypothetical protein